MTAERWEEIKGLVAGALDIPAAKRESYLDSACGADKDLRREVESLLAAADGGDTIPGARAAVEAARDTYMVDAESTLRTAIERTLGKDYEILRPLGGGGMGAVYLARERELERLVAIKVLRPDLASVLHGPERFRREARIAAQLSHPGILPMHAFGETGGIWFFVMGYVRGQSLADRLRLEGRVPPDDARRILIELADALDCAHRHGVVHRDIKPSNILLDDETGRSILADFGISKLTGADDSLTMTGLVFGSPHYMSPEQSLAAGDVDERSDLYSLGAVGYTMLAGREPFAGLSAQELMYRRLSQDPVPISAVAPAVSADLASVIMRCLARDPALRWPTARELRDSLARTSDAVAAATLPESVRDLPSFAPYAAVWAVAWTALALFALRSPGDRALLLLIAFLVPLGLVLHVWNIGRNGLRPLDLARIASWPPEWWGLWWPRALRRPSDLWARLPWHLRLVRVVLAVFFIGVPALIVVRESGLGGSLSSEGRIDIFIVAEGALVLGTTAVVATGFWWARRQGLTVSEAAHVLFGPTTPVPIWNAPHVARLLSTPAGGVRPPDRDAPADHRRAIGDVVALLGAEVSGVGAEALRAATWLAGEIERCDREIVSLMRDASPGEIDRLTTRLATLDTSIGPELGERRELRALVQHQLELVRRMRARHELLSQRRDHLFYLMRGLWAQLCLLRNGAAAGPVTAAGPVNGVRDLCAEIDAAASDSDASGRSNETRPQ